MLFFWSLAVFLLARAFGQQPSVDLTVGKVNGVRKTFSDGTSQYTVKQFLGIPYAQPPLGDLRLKRPEPLEQLNGSPYNATFYRSFCVQGYIQSSSEREDEDCLYLNVFVPDSAPDQSTGHAVMIWIHGGGFAAGSSEEYPGDVLSALGNVIVVTVNYRLSFWGFFSTMDSASPGNYGLFDQALAFKWVHDNIEKFGGDNKRVTIFGQSAGAMSANFHGLYDKNNGLFQRIIAHSGSPTTPYLDLTRDRKDGAMLLAKKMNCFVEDSNEMVECLKLKPWRDIKAAVLQANGDVQYWDTMFFMPVVDGDLIKTDLRYLGENQHKADEQIKFFKTLDFLNGICLYDGGAILNIAVGSFGDLENFQHSQEEMYNTYINTLSRVGSDKPFPDHIRKSILHEYTNWGTPEANESVRLEFTRLLTDAVYAAPAAEISNVHSGDNIVTGNTYAFVFNPVSTSRMFWTASWLPGADHGEELPFVFGERYINGASWEITLSAQIMTYWANFAKSGNPNYPRPRFKSLTHGIIRQHKHIWFWIRTWGYNQRNIYWRLEPLTSGCRSYHCYRSAIVRNKPTVLHLARREMQLLLYTFSLV